MDFSSESRSCLTDALAQLATLEQTQVEIWVNLQKFKDPQQTRRVSPNAHHLAKSIYSCSFESVKIKEWKWNRQQSALSICAMQSSLTNEYDMDGFRELLALHVHTLYTIFTILLTLWNSEQKNGLLIKLFCFSSDFDETWWSCRYPCVLKFH